MTRRWSSPARGERSRIDHDGKANGRAELAPIQAIVAEHLDLQAQQTDERACARRHHPAGDLEPSGAHFEIETRKQREKHGMIVSLIAPRHGHPSDVGDLATRLDDQAARILGRKRARRRHEAARRDRVFTVPPEHVNRSQVVVITLAAIVTAVTRIVVPPLFDDGLVTQAVGRIPRVIVGEGEAKPRAVKNSMCEGVK